MLLLLFLLTTLSCSINGILEDFSCFRSDARGDATFINMHLPNIGGTPVSRQHILRERRVRFFFNSALRYNNDVRRELIEMSLDLLENAQTYFDTSDRLAFRIAWERMDSNSLIMPEFIDWLTDEEVNYSITTLHALWSWMPFNYVFGPMYRSDDDVTALLDYPLENIVGEETFGLFLNLNSAINRFLNEPNRPNGVPQCITDIRKIITKLIQQATVGYAFLPDQWSVTLDRNGVPMRDADNNILYHVKKKGENRRRQRYASNPFTQDVYCLETINATKNDLRNGVLYMDKLQNTIWDLKSLNLMIARGIFVRVKNNFFSKNYSSWKDWWNNSCWQNNVNGIYEYGFRLAESWAISQAYGIKFNDKSFAVGIISNDIRSGSTDNWVGSGSWGTGHEYAGLMFFDKNGRPVALVITDRLTGSFGAGWSYVYNDGKWEYESQDSWADYRFVDRTESLDSNALQFIIDERGTRSHLGDFQPLPLPNSDLQHPIGRIVPNVPDFNNIIPNPIRLVITRVNDATPLLWLRNERVKKRAYPRSSMRFTNNFTALVNDAIYDPHQDRDLMFTMVIFDGRGQAKAFIDLFESPYFVIYTKSKDFGWREQRNLTTIDFSQLETISNFAAITEIAAQPIDEINRRLPKLCSYFEPIMCFAPC